MSTRLGFDGWLGPVWAVLTLLILTILLIWSARNDEWRMRGLGDSLAALKLGAEVETRMLLARALAPGIVASGSHQAGLPAEPRAGSLHSTVASLPPFGRKPGAGGRTRRSQVRNFVFRLKYQSLSEAGLNVYF